MFSQTTEYALRAMICLASLEREGTAAASSERISQLARIPAGYLSKIMRALVVGGLVGSKRGPHGGFSLGCPPEDITLLDVVMAVDAGHAWRRAAEEQQAMPATLLHRRLDQLTHVLLESLRGTTLAEILGDARQQNANAA